MIFIAKFTFLLFILAYVAYSVKTASLLSSKSWLLSCKPCQDALQECSVCLKKDCQLCINQIPDSECKKCGFEITSIGDFLMCDSSLEYHRIACTISCRMRDNNGSFYRYGTCQNGTELCECRKDIIITSSSTSHAQLASTPLEWETSTPTDQTTTARSDTSTIELSTTIWGETSTTIEWLPSKTTYSDASTGADSTTMTTAETLISTMSYNRMRVLHKNTFKDMSMLQYIDLSYNNFVSIEAYFFKGLELSLHTLLFNNNNLVNIDRGTFNGFNQISVFNVSSNPIYETYQIALSNGNLSLTLKD